MKQATIYPDIKSPKTLQDPDDINRVNKTVFTILLPLFLLVLFIRLLVLFSLLLVGFAISALGDIVSVVAVAGDV